MTNRKVTCRRHPDTGAFVFTDGQPGLRVTVEVNETADGQWQYQDKGVFSTRQGAVACGLWWTSVYRHMSEQTLEACLNSLDELIVNEKKHGTERAFYDT